MHREGCVCVHACVSLCQKARMGNWVYYTVLCDYSMCIIMIRGNLERNHSWESDGRDSN